MKKLPIILIIISAEFFVSCQKKANYLSSLQTGKDYPFYTTYATAQERSDVQTARHYCFLS